MMKDWWKLKKHKQLISRQRKRQNVSDLQLWRKHRQKMMKQIVSKQNKNKKFWINKKGN